MYCHNRIKIEGMENGETYCLLELGHKGPCQKAKLVLGITYSEGDRRYEAPSDPSAEQLAQFFHDTYERLAPCFGYETRKESAKHWSDVPEKNRNLMIAVCAEVLAHLRGK